LSSVSAAFAAITDWLNVTFPLDPDPFRPAEFVGDLGEATGDVFGGMTDRGRGLHGYSQSFEFDRGKILLAFGGQRETAFLSIPGEGCAYVRDWDRLTTLLRDRLGARITRWDGAVDDYQGKHSVDLAVQLYLLGGFNGGGRRPRYRQHGDWLEPYGAGRTFEVGSRRNGKLARIYEKGKQLGCPNHPWVRWEVEMHNIDRVIPWEVLSAPGDYVAGAYPCMTWVRERACRIRTIKCQDAITYDRLTRAGSLAYGPLINVMLEREGNAERVVEKLRRNGVPRRLEFTDDFLRTRESGDEL
jgi:phage replication initiation protein